MRTDGRRDLWRACRHGSVCVADRRESGASEWVRRKTGLCLLTPSVVVTPPHRRVPRASLTDAPPAPPHQVQRFCVTLSFCVCFVRPSAQGRLLLRVLRAFRLLRCVKLFYQLASRHTHTLSYLSYCSFGLAHAFHKRVLVSGIILHGLRIRAST